MTPLVAVAVALLGLLLLIARLTDRARCRSIEEAWSGVLSSSGSNVLTYLVLAVDEHRVGLDLAARAARARDAARLRRAVAIVDGFAPGLAEGLQAVRTMSRVVAALVPLPPVAPSVWRAWRLRGLSAAALVIHVVLVAAAERVRLRVWLLGRALGICLASLRCSATHAETEPAWSRVESALHDLGVVGDEAELSYRRVVTALDAMGRFATA